MREIIALILATLIATTLIATTTNAANTINANSPDRVSAADFSSMQAGQDLPPDWESIIIPSIPRHTQYQLKDVGGVTVLRAKSDASMSGMARKVDINPHATPWLQWRWRTARLNEGSQLGSKAGDDFPLRIYVFFDYDIMLLPFFKRVIIRIARALYGERLPLAALCYVWTEDDPVGSTTLSAYTDRLHMVVATSGTEKVGQWVSVERNISNDYKHAFGEPVPRITGIAVASDSDETGAQSLAWYGDIAFTNQSQLNP